MRIFNGTVYRDMTPEEKAEMEKSSKVAALQHRHHPLSDREVMKLMLVNHVNDLGLDNNTALRMAEFYPEWTVGMDYVPGFTVNRNGKLWRCLQGHTAQTGWEPENAPSLWEQVCFRYDGSLDDPIPYDGNMALENGKHYFQQDVIYLCIRSSGSPVYHPLSDLVGLYVEAV